MGATYGIYLGMAAAACLFAALAERAREKTYTLCRVTLAGQEHACRVSAASFWLVFAAIPLILVSGLRWGIGVDAQNYFWMFTNIHYNLANHAEVGFYLLCQLVWYFTEDMSILFLLCAGITVAFVMLAIRQSSRNMLMSVFLYMGMGYFFYSLNSMRHFMAIAIFLYAYKHIRAGQFWRYAGWILLAASFQKVALVALPLYFILRIRWKCYWYAIAGGLLVLAAVLHRPLLDFAYRHGFGSGHRGRDFRLVGCEHPDHPGPVGAGVPLPKAAAGEGSREYHPDQCRLVRIFVLYNLRLDPGVYPDRTVSHRACPVPGAGADRLRGRFGAGTPAAPAAVHHRRIHRLYRLYAADHLECPGPHHRLGPLSKRVPAHGIL